jgi:TolA protein
MKWLPSKEKRSFSFFLQVSFFVHFMMFAGHWVIINWGPSKSIEFKPTLRVDLVGLPDLKKADIAKLKKRPKPAKVEEKKEEPKKEKEVSREDLLKTLDKIASEKAFKTKANKKDKKKKKKSKDTKTASKSKKKSKKDDKSHVTDEFKALYKGNVISKGSSMEGEQSEGSSGYAQLVQEHVQDHWELPPWLANSTHKAMVQVFLNPRGKLVHYVFMRKSSNNQFNDAVETAIKSSSPFPKVPNDLHHQVEQEGIRLGFPL